MPSWREYVQQWEKLNGKSKDVQVRRFANYFIKAGNTKRNWKPSNGVMSYAELRIRDIQNNPDILQKYKGYMYSEKIDGWMAIWSGSKLYTKSGKRVFHAPQKFLDLLPKNIPLVGELVIKGMQASKVAALQNSSGDWANARYYVFDMPMERKLTFREREKKYRAIVKKQCKIHKGKCPLRALKHRTIRNVKDFLRDFYAITGCTGKYKKKMYKQCLGEGVVITDPESLYVPGRAKRNVRVKLKRRQDMEAKVVGYGAKKASLRVKLHNGKNFTLGIGFTNDQRSNLQKYFPINSLVKFSYRSLSHNGIPKEARIIGKRHRSDLA